MSVARAHRLAAVSRRSASWLALAAIVAALSACGNDGDGTIPPTNADALKTELDDVESFRDSGECDNAAAAAQRFQDQVELLPAAVDDGVKRALREGGIQLEALTHDEEQCGGPTGTTGVQGETTEATTSTTTTEATAEEPQTEEPPIDEDGGNGPPGGEPPGQGGGGSGGTGSGKKGD